MICDQTGREIRDELAELKAENIRLREVVDLAISWLTPFSQVLGDGLRDMAREALVRTKP
jgi:hypothetical protein